MTLLKCVVSLMIMIVYLVRAQQDIFTKENGSFRFFPVKNSSVSFKVDARTNVHIVLTKKPKFSVPMYELIIGGWGNKKSLLRRLTCLPVEKDEVQTIQILNDQEFRGFWIRWDNGNILVGREGEDKPFMSWQDPDPSPVAYAGIRTTWGSDGNWKLANGTRYNGGEDRMIDVRTELNQAAQYFPVPGRAMHFKVRAPNDAIIDLTAQPRQTDPMYQIVIGGWSNTKSVIRKLVCNIANKDEKQTPAILNNQEFREFWLRWDHGNVLVGREGEAQPFLAWQDPSPVRVAYVGVRTTWGSTGNWKIASGSNSEDSIDVSTENTARWQFFPISGDSLKIKVRASNDATIGLATHPWETDPMYEVVIGGWSNSKSVLRKFCCKNPDKAKAEANEFLKSGHLLGFWIRWDGGNFQVGREGETDPFISWRDQQPFAVAYMGIRTGFHSTGIWKFDDLSAEDILTETAIKQHNFKPMVCVPTVTRLRQGTACAGQTVFEDNFDTLREDVWQVQQYVPIDHPELPFVSYQRSTVSVKNGNLRIAPMLQQNQPGFSHHSMFGSLDLYKGCTSGQSSSCFVDASDGPTVIPPIVSGRVISRSSFAFTYGTISIRAKLPKGDWIYPEILLESFSKKFIYGTKNSGILKIASARGNKVLTNGATQYGNKVLYSGPVIDTMCHDTLLTTKISDKNWGDDFHVYSIKWTPEHLILSVDGEEYGRVEPTSGGFRSRLPKTCAGPDQPGMAPFDEHFYITLGLAAGGHLVFPDAVVTKDNHAKPWKNHASKAALKFWNDIDTWQDTWERPELLVDYVKVVAL